jgi:hypothetical protein
MRPKCPLMPVNLSIEVHEKGSREIARSIGFSYGL